MADSVVDARTIQDLVVEIHRDERDFNEGDLLHRIWRFLRYELRRLPLSLINLGEWRVNDELVQRFVDMPSDTMPPIVFDPIDSSIIDGIHRANARARSGSLDIMAFVGLIDHVDPDWTREPTED